MENTIMFIILSIIKFPLFHSSTGIYKMIKPIPQLYCLAFFPSVSKSYFCWNCHTIYIHVLPSPSSEQVVNRFFRSAKLQHSQHTPHTAKGSCNWNWIWNRGLQLQLTLNLKPLLWLALPFVSEQLFLRPERVAPDTAILLITDQTQHTVARPLER